MDDGIGKQPFLRGLKNVTELRDATFTVWISIPGGIISGDMCSTERFLEELLDSPEVPYGDREGIRDWAKGQIKDIDPASSGLLNLINARVAVGSGLKEARFAQVNFADIAAWGFGRLVKD